MPFLRADAAVAGVAACTGILCMQTSSPLTKRRCNPLQTSAGARLRAAVEAERPLQIVGAVNAYSAILAASAGFRALYLSGSGVACASYGWPDLGMTTLNDVLEDVRRVSAATDRPLLVDADTGWGNAFGVARTVRDMIRAGAAGIHLEDQVAAKRCGHRPNKELVSADEMCDRLKAAADGRTDADFVLMARTDAAANEGTDAAIERACRYRDAGADMIFAEAVTTLEDYAKFTQKRSACRCWRTSRSSARRRCLRPTNWPARACGWCCTRSAPSAR